MSNGSDINEIKQNLELEREEKNKLKTELDTMKVFFAELEATNNHLIAATWRERDLKKKLSDTINELNQTKELVEAQNKRITESINYARKIQLAINPTEADLIEAFNKSFILYLPKDVISGDFPWIYHIGDYLYVAAVDCTGHGVPGAMMSMIGNLLLNDIINNDVALTPSQILLNLHNSVVNTLKQDVPGSDSNDGMDIAMCRINKKTKEVVYSGAHRPLFYMCNGEIQVINGDKFPIGGIHYRGKNNYTDNILNYNEGDSIYLFTDGFPDQIGGDEKRKLMSRNIKSFIEEHRGNSFSELKEGLLEHFKTWKGSNKQIDDVLMIGIKF